MYFNLLNKFVRREKHARAPYGHREGNFALGAWVGRQRLAFRRGQISAEQVRLFEALPGWTWSPRSDGFRKGLSALKTFVRREGHAAVPYAHREDGFKLGSWVRSRRSEYSRGRLDAERIQLLEVVSGWSWSRKDPFFVNLERLYRFVEREGHARVPSKHRENGFYLGRWVEHLRRAQADSRLPRDRARLLERLPEWAWRPKKDLFPRGLRVLRTFLRREGHSRVPRSHVEAGVRLGVWVANRRADYRKGRLSSRQSQSLEKLRGWTWDSRRDSFEEGFDHLLRFVKRDGDACVPVGHVERGFRLGAWVHKRRGERDRMSETRRRRLAALPGWVWHKYDAQFEEGLRLLRAFAKRDGHARVPARHIEAGFHLGRWVGHLRHRKHTISRERRRALEAIPGWSWRLRERRVRRRARSRKLRRLRPPTKRTRSQFSQNSH
ncbi:MAG: helicase associated domain-containing protein [Vicinamibacteria bacterium]